VADLASQIAELDAHLLERWRRGDGLNEAKLSVRRVLRIDVDKGEIQQAFARFSRTFA
jgi:hypothetical protein